MCVCIQGKYGLTVGVNDLTLKCSCQDASLISSGWLSFFDQPHKLLIMDNQGGNFSFPFILDTTTSPHTVTYDTASCSAASLIPEGNHKLTFEFTGAAANMHSTAESAFAGPYKDTVRTKYSILTL
jgi:hypothetical protein